MASSNKALAYLSGTLTQGSNDAFVQLSVATALTGLTKSAYLLRELVVEWAGTQGLAGVTSEYTICLTRKSFTAIPTVLEKSLIHMCKRTQMFATSGYGNADAALRIPFGEFEAPIIVEDPIYAQLDSTSTAATNVVRIRLGYQLVSISEVDRLQLIANSLS